MLRLGLLTPGSGLPQPLKMVVDFPKDLRESIKITHRRVCNLMERADAIMLGIIKINCMSKKTITMHKKNPKKLNPNFGKSTRNYINTTVAFL